MHVTYFVTFLSVICIVNSTPPSFVNRCKYGDSECTKESTVVAIPIFAAGLPEYGVEKLDPVTFNKVDASSPNLKFILTDVEVTGLSGCKPKQIQHGSKLELKILCQAKLNGNYELNGQVLVLPIKGKGKIHVDLKTTQINVEANYEEKLGDDGKKHWHITKWSYTFELQDKSDVVFENLFDGNEVLGQAARELIANNGNDIIKEIGSPMIKAAVARVVKNIERFFKAIPVEDLILN
ncbi:protein takeout-like [Bombyx mandarina]|uniref:Protein takeout-like n=1 Tax=Bombyx mandarina TaxID=7092 RepID=A0A6J2K845_BOMMA|nr:protein takeout-like [Bombyx mandarina]